MISASKDNVPSHHRAHFPAVYFQNLMESVLFFLLLFNEFLCRKRAKRLFFPVRFSSKTANWKDLGADKLEHNM